MSCKKYVTKILLLGNWKDKDDWENEFKVNLKQKSEMFCKDIEFEFKEAVPPSMVGFFPHNLWDNITLDIRLAQAQVLSSNVDIIVCINDGRWPGYKKQHLDALEKKCGSLVVWTPETVTNEDFLKEEDPGGLRPGVIAFHGDIKLLVSIVLFLSLRSEENLHGA